MESQIQNSFIPDDTVRKEGTKRTAGGRGAFDILVLAGVILLVVSIALAVAVFLYEQYLQSSLASKRQQLERAQSAFEPALIAELTRLDDRMKAGEDVLSRHIAPSALFAVLEQLTLETVSFKNMTFQVVTPSEINISLNGIARSVNSVALQADLFGRHSAIASPIFSNINREQGGVTFDVEALVNPNAIRYVNVLQARSAPEAQQAGQPNQLDTGGAAQQQEQQQAPPPADGANSESDGNNTNSQESSSGESGDSIPLFAP